MKTKIQKTIIATSIAALFIAPVAAFAKDKDKWEYHEDQWSQVKSYGDVPLSQDSAGEWGPWSEFVQPAAGGPAVGFLPQVGGEKYRPLAPVNPVNPPVTDTCGAGAWCGYAAYTNESSNYGAKYSRTGPHPGRIALNLSRSGEGYEGTASYRITGLPGKPAPLQGDSGSVPIDFYYSDQHIGSFEDNESDVRIDGGEGNDWRATEHYDPTYATHGDFRKYLYGDGYGDGSEGSYVAGIVTPLADIVALGNVDAKYVGVTVDPNTWGGNNFPGARVEIDVHFGSGKWEGIWNGGHDGDGHMGIVANGDINGAEILSTNVSSLDDGVELVGTVNGNFAGPEAAALIGITDITQTILEAESVKHEVNLFITTKQTPE